ncbi:MAG: universal stress protein [Gemmatimonadetes bacterium]|nr:universal stress protein [Gemmatimonadota bacterium]NNM05740.1 universal stress protein [Gemmatimonadota bacterium]
MKRFEKILSIFDSDERDTTALRLALRLAGDSAGSLSVVHVIPPLPSDIPEGIGGLDDLKKALVQAAEASLQSAVDQLPETTVPLDTRVFWGHTAMEVSRVVVREGFDLVMKGTGRRKRIPGQHLGSVDMRLLRKCPCPVWLVKPGGHETVTSILATIDPSNTEEDHHVLNESILELGLSVAEMENADLHVLHAWAPWGESLLRSRMRSEEFGGYVKQMRSRAARGLTDFLRPFDDAISPMNRHLLEGDPEVVVPDFVRTHDVDVIVMGTVGRTGVPGFLIGNTAEKILASVDCSVLAVKPSGFRTPVDA